MQWYTRCAYYVVFLVCLACWNFGGLNALIFHFFGGVIGYVGASCKVVAMLSVVCQSVQRTTPNNPLNECQLRMLPPLLGSLAPSDGF